VSDIGLRLDGLVLLATIALGAAIFVLIAAIAAVRTLVVRRPGGRAPRIAGVAALLGLGSGVIFVLVAVVANTAPASDAPDWLDWMSLPYAAAFVAGIWLLVRLK
jgi:hypothetical protein